MNNGMKAKNFRIGNVVKYDNRIFTIHTIADEFPTLDTIEFGIGVVDWNNIEPIKLNEDWLRGLGFEGHDMDMWKVLPTGNELELHIDCVREGEFEHACLTQGRTDKGIPGKDYKFAYLNDLKYVHELQNLFFALSGTELEIETLA